MRHYPVPLAVLPFDYFYKQKTAYEIYQCDWSSDVCSSDLVPLTKGRRHARDRYRRVPAIAAAEAPVVVRPAVARRTLSARLSGARGGRGRRGGTARGAARGGAPPRGAAHGLPLPTRHEPAAASHRAGLR